MPFIRSLSLEHGYVRAEANRTAFAMEAVRSADGAVVDSFMLTREERRSGSGST